MLTHEDGINENVRLPVPVLAHDSDGNKQKIISFGELIAASKEKKYYYFSIETSFSTGYPFSQILGILESEYQFSPKNIRLQKSGRSVRQSMQISRSNIKYMSRQSEKTVI